MHNHLSNPDLLVRPPPRARHNLAAI
jgi:hypothetical protein